MKRSAPHHFVRDVTAIGAASVLVFAVGLALESGIAAVLGLIGVLFVAMLVPFIVIYFDEHPAPPGRRQP